MSRSRISHELLTRNVPLSLSRSRRGSESRRTRDEVPIHLQSVTRGSAAAVPGRASAMDDRSAVSIGGRR